MCSMRRMVVRRVALLLTLLLAMAGLPVGCATGTSPELAILIPDAAVVVVKESPDGAASGDSGSAEDGGTDSEVAAPVPKIASLTPSSAAAGSPGPLVVVGGTDFVARSIVKVDGDAIATTFVSPTELRVTLPTAKISKVGSLDVMVSTSGPGGGDSAKLPFAVESPGPLPTTIAPLSAVAGSPDVTLTVTGTRFMTGALVQFSGAPLTTVFFDATKLTATIPASKMTASGAFDITVKNPAPGGGVSTPISFTVTNPIVTLSSVTPASTLVGAAATNITVNGAGFVAATKLSFNGVAITTSFVSGSQLTGTIPAASLATVGDFPIVATNPPPGGGLSAPVTFRVQYAAPTVASLAPASTTAGSGPVTVAVTGTGYYAASQVTFDGAAAATTYVGPTEVRATLTAAQLAVAGTINVRVTTPAPGGGTSSALPFTVNNPAPTITSLAPSSATVGSPDTVVTVNGTGFVAASVVRVNGVAVATTYVSATQIRGTIPAASLATPANLAVTVVNAGPGGGTSAAATFTVGCNSAGVDVQLGAINTVTTKNTDFALAPNMSRFTDSGTCPATLDAANLQPGKYFIVQNTAGVPVVLSAWAVCPVTTAEEDCFMAHYRRATGPATAAERLACTGAVSEGLNGIGGYASPESGTSGWCPGLTKANGRGLSLAVCERAVVHVQPWSLGSTAYPPPAQVRFKPEAP